jgi:hypothetical protein
MFLLGLAGNSIDLIEPYRELLLVASIPGLLYLIRYEVIRPIVRDEVVKPLGKILATSVRALLKQQDALTKLEVLEAADD